MLEKIKVVSYTRVSTDKQLEGKGIEERPALHEMIKYCKNPPVKYVIVDKMDRLAREPMEQLFIKNPLILEKN